jgi:PelA/Pel-15E family pectate lyase
MLHVIELLQGVANGRDEFAFAPSALRKHAAASYRRGIECLLATQMTVNGRRTVWCQQNDAITLQAASARNYEMPSLASGESASIVMFLMQLPHPDSNVIAAVHVAVAWFKKTEVMNVAYQRTDNGRELVPSTGSGPLWARYYQIGTDRPIFGDRDKSIHDSVNDLSRERRNGYGWYGGNGAAVLERYPEWAKAHPANE